MTSTSTMTATGGKRACGFGGELLRNSKIEEQDGYLDPFYNPLNPGMSTIDQEQTSAYSSHKDIACGPFYLTDEEMEAKKIHL